MCEPAHSIIQYQDPDKWRDRDDHNGDGPGGSSAQTVREGFQGRFKKWLKRFGTFCHLSLMGKGHSEAITAARPASASVQHYLDELDDAKFETDWWCRKVRVDNKSDYMRKLAAGSLYLPDDMSPLDAAERYANAVCIGNMTAFRRFIETSMRNTDRPMAYASTFLKQMLQKRPNPVQRKIKAVHKDLFEMLLDHHWAWGSDQTIENGIVNARIHRGFSRTTSTTAQFPLESLIKVILGLTRKREILVPAWAEDNKLWLPK